MWNTKEIIKREFERSSSLLEYRGMWNKLGTSCNVAVPRDMVMRILRELDAFALPKARELQRRFYTGAKRHFTRAHVFLVFHTGPRQNTSLFPNSNSIRIQNISSNAFQETEWILVFINYQNVLLSVVSLNMW